MPTTLKAAQATLRALGVTLRRTGYGPELRVNFRGGRAVSQFECLLGVGSCRSAWGPRRVVPDVQSTAEVGRKPLGRFGEAAKKLINTATGNQPTALNLIADDTYYTTGPLL